MVFTLEDIFSSIYRVADTLPIESLAKSTRFGEHKSQFKGDGHDFDRMTEYDPQSHVISQIDWRAMTRDKVYVRESRVTKDFSVLVLADLSTSMTFGVESQDKERMLLEVFGSLGLACFHSQDPMGLIGFAEDIIFDEQPKVGEDQIYYLTSQLYDFFEGLDSDGRGKLNRKKTDFYKAFDFIRRTYANKQCFVVVISDFVGLAELTSLEFLNDVTSHHEVVFVFLDDPHEFDFGGLGYVHQEDIETGRMRVVSRLKNRQMELEIRGRRKQFRQSLQEVGIDSIVLEYGKHLERLYRFFVGRYESFKS